jgi:cell wall-associated NlpC family hydrolase
VIAEAGVTKVIAAGGGLVCGVAVLAGMAGAGQYAAAQTGSATVACRYASSIGPALRLTSEQITNARHIVDTADDLGLPQRAAVIAVATALQESSLRSGAVGDGQAFGIFQQRPDQGWGSRAQVTDPRHAARSFFARLVKVKDWNRKPLTVVAQAIQRSALPNAYAEHERQAVRIVQALHLYVRPHDSAQLSAHDLGVVRRTVDAAVLVGLPRSTLVADIAARLPDASRPQAEQAMASVAARLCSDLSRAIDDVAGLATLGIGGRGGVALQAALGMIGIPYSWGGGGPRGPTFGIGRGAGTQGFDCSGLAEYAWAKAGIRVGGHTSTQWQAGVRVPRSQLIPGDLVFFATDPRDPSTIYHVVLNIDGQRYVHAPYTGSQVQVGHWTPRQHAQYAGAVRPG